MADDRQSDNFRKGQKLARFSRLSHTSDFSINWRVKHLGQMTSGPAIPQRKSMTVDKDDRMIGGHR
jgi:hypothetical protein